MSKFKYGITDCIPLWESELIVPILTGIKLAPGSSEYVETNNVVTSSYSNEHNASGIPLYHPSFPSPAKVLRCSHCDSTFDSREDQIEHYRSDWHRFNLKRSLDGLGSVTCEQFLNNSWEDGDDEEDSSDSDSENVEEEDNSNTDDDGMSVLRTPFFFFVNVDQDLISIHKNVLRRKKTECANGVELVHQIKTACNNLYWIIILVGGGHFAAAVFKGSDVVVHKTFHSYTVRAKQGGSQSSRDNKSATSHPKSAGSSLRRFNEQSFNQHVLDLLEEWRGHFTDCHLIFFRCPKTNNHLLFGKDSPILLKTDSRLRTIPFPTKKPNFSEVKRVHKNLCQIYVHGKFEDMIALKKTEKEKSPKKTFSPAKPQRSPEEKSPKKVSKEEISGLNTKDLHRSSSSESGNDSDCQVMDMVCSLQTLSTVDLNPYDCFVPKVRPRRRKKKREQTGSDEGSQNQFSNTATQEENEKELSSEVSLQLRQLQNFVYSACRTGDLVLLKIFREFVKERDVTSVPDAIPAHVVDTVLELDSEFDFFSLEFGSLKKSMLHVAAENCHRDMIWWLLEEGCDPAVRNTDKKTPYDATKVKESKLHFRRFMAAFPDKYDYKKAGIPSPLTKAQETQQKQKVLDKKKKLRNSRAEKEKKLKKEKEERLKEEKERQSFLLLSDREKRAIAAEKRLREKASSNLNQVLRCFSCAKDISNVEPFQYFDYKFCSTACVKEHRTKPSTS